MQSPSNDAWLTRLQAVECQDATYPARDPALVFAAARGSEIFDAEGNSYIDLCAGFGSLALGHNARASQAVLGRYVSEAEGAAPLPILHGLGDVYPSVAKVRLLEQLLKLLPSHFAKISLALSGSQAVEIAMKTAMLSTKASGFIAFKNAYHGVDLGVLPVTSRADFKAPFGAWLAGAAVIELPYGASVSDVSQAIQALREKSGFAGILVEPVQGRGGVVSPPAGWLAALLDLAHKERGLLIFDEVFTGLGRLGRWTAAEEIPCDLLCLGKTLGGGIPLSACVGSAAAMDAWPKSSGEALHTGTFFGHPLACEMALATLNEIQSQKLVERSRSFGAKMLTDLQRDLGHHPSVKEIRGHGMMIGIEFQMAGMGAKMMDLLRARGVIALASGPQGQVLQITPALNLSSELWQVALTKLVAVSSSTHPTPPNSAAS